MCIKNTLSFLVNCEKTTFVRNNYCEKCNMTSVNLEKTLEYLKIPKSSRSEKYYMCVKEYFDILFFTLKCIHKQKNKCITEPAKTIKLFFQKASQKMDFCPVVMSKPLMPI